MTTMPRRPTAYAKQRQFHRTPIRMSAEIHLGEAVVTATTRDLSEGGVGFICGRKLDVGEKLMVRCSRSGEKPVTRMCEVVTCRATDAGEFRVGTRFIEYKGRSLAQTLSGWFRAKG